MVAAANLGNGNFLVWQSAREVASEDAIVDKEQGLPAILGVRAQQPRACFAHARCS